MPRNCFQLSFLALITCQAQLPKWLCVSHSTGCNGLLQGSLLQSSLILIRWLFFQNTLNVKLTVPNEDEVWSAFCVLKVCSSLINAVVMFYIDTMWYNLTEPRLFILTSWSTLVVLLKQGNSNSNSWNEQSHHRLTLRGLIVFLVMDIWDLYVFKNII